MSAENVKWQESNPSPEDSGFVPEIKWVEQPGSRNLELKQAEKDRDARQLESVRASLAETDSLKSPGSGVEFYPDPADSVLSTRQKLPESPGFFRRIRRFALVTLAALGIHGGDLKAEGTNDVLQVTNNIPAVATADLAAKQKQAFEIAQRAEAMRMSSTTDKRGRTVLNYTSQTIPAGSSGSPNFSGQNLQQPQSVEGKIPAILDPVGALGRFVTKNFPSARVTTYGQPGLGYEVRETGAQGSWSTEIGVPGKPTIRRTSKTSSYEGGFENANKVPKKRY